MLRIARSRFCASLLALWVPLVVGLTGIVPRCAAHLAAAQDAPSSVPAHHSHHDHHDHHGQAPSGESHSCSCIGGCTVSRNDLIRPELPSVLAVISFVAADPPAADGFSASIGERGGDHYATGPPTL